jgi:O-antigen/teichoic acid export membrane protein
MSVTRRTGLSIIANWAALLSGFLITYFLSPFVVNRLGPTGYGTWVILGSLTSYMALMDLGMRGAITRFVARYHASQDHNAASEAVSAALWFRQWIAVLLILVAAVLVYLLDRFTSIPPEMLAQARAAFAVNAVSVVVVLIGGVFGGVLAALNHYGTLSTAAVLQGLVRAVGTVLLLRAGYSLLALALVELAASLLAESLIVIRSLQRYPELRIRFHVPDRATRRQLTAYSGSLMLVQMFARAAQYSQTLIVGAFISVSAVAFFAIGHVLVESVRQVLLTIGPVFMPIASRFDATGRSDSLRRLLSTGTRLILVVILPILVTLYVRGETFIGLWMGLEYAARASAVLRILAISMFFQAGTSAAHNILFGRGALRPAIVCNGVEAAGAIGLSFLLAPHFGLTGIAWASTAPVVAVRSTIWLHYVRRHLNIQVIDQLREGWIRPVAAAAPLLMTAALIDRRWVAPSVSYFFLQVAVSLLVYAVSCLIFLWPDVKTAWALLRGSSLTSTENGVPAPI